jgi:hypothetical protein
MEHPLGDSQGFTCEWTDMLKLIGAVFSITQNVPAKLIFFYTTGEGLVALHSFYMGLAGIKTLDLNSYIYHYCHCLRGKMITTAVEYLD